MIEGLKRVKGLESTLTPSAQQAAVWESMALSSGTAHSIGFCAFNKSIASELQKRVPAGCDAMTMHSMGFKAVNTRFERPKVDGYRVQGIISEITGRDPRELRRYENDMVQATERLVSLCKMNLSGWSEAGFEDVDAEELQRLAAHYDIELGKHQSKIFDLVPKVLKRCMDVKADNTVDFDDMVWLPIVLDLLIPKYDLLLVDECVPGWTPIMLADGSSMTIQEIVESDQEVRVRSYSTKTGHSFDSLVIGRQKILNQKPLVKIKAQHYSRTGTNKKSNFVVCTVDHKVWTVNRGWVPAGEVKVGDDIVVETAAKTTQKGKITSKGRADLATLQKGNKRGLGQPARATKESFNKIRGGNGKGPTLPEKTLCNALGEGWQLHYVFKTGVNQMDGCGYPNHYKLDIVCLSRKICVEVDGHSHRSQQVQAADARKTAYLESCGWKVFRVSNRRAIQNAAEEAAVINSAGATVAHCDDGVNCPAPARVVSVEPVDIRDSYVYDITVDRFHNFYANGVLVHNCQDLNKVQQELSVRAGKRLIYCGDVRQAIYGFAGADARSMSTLQERLEQTACGCITLPLTVTRRCGKAIVAEAQKIVPDFEAFETNPEGSVGQASYTGEPGKSYHSQVKDGDMVLCRCNAPLVSQCFKFLRAGRKANIQGRDVGQGLIATIKRLRADNIADLAGKLSDWLHSETTKENAKRNPSESRLIMLQDRYDCLSCFMEDQKTVDGVIGRIEAIFTDDRDSRGIKLSSVHKAKGLESENVFFLMPKGAECPHPMARTAWQREQEMNVLYVGITRSINCLTYVYETEEKSQVITRSGGRAGMQGLVDALDNVAAKHGIDAQRLEDEEGYEN